MTTKFLIIGLPPSYTSEHLHQLLIGVARGLSAIEMLPETIAVGVGYVESASQSVGRRAISTLQALGHSLGARLLICGEESATFRVLCKRWETERAASDRSRSAAEETRHASAYPSSGQGRPGPSV